MEEQAVSLQLDVQSVEGPGPDKRARQTRQIIVHGIVQVSRKAFGRPVPRII